MARRCPGCGLWALAWLVFLGGAARAEEGGSAATLVALAPSGLAGAQAPDASSLVTLVSSPFGASWRALPQRPDRTKGQPVEMGGDRVNRFIYRDTFGEPWCLEDAAIEGLSCLRWDGAAKALDIQGAGPGRRRVSLTYHFTAPYDAKELVTGIEGVISGTTSDHVELSLSLNGERFVLPARACGRPEGNPFHLTSTASYDFDGPRFWIRVAAELGPGSRVALRRFEANCRVKPSGRPEVALSPDPTGRLCYRDAFASSRILHLAEVLNSQALEWHRGAVFVRGQEGGPTQVVVRQKFIAPAALRSVVVRIRHAVNQRELGGTSSFGLSLDGANLLASHSSPGPQGAFRGLTELRLDDPAALADARQFFLHVTLANNAGRNTPPSNVLSAIEVEATSAERTAATAAAPPR